MQSRSPQPSDGKLTRKAGKIALPSSIWFILVSEAGERFSYYSLRAILTLYFIHLGYSEGDSVAMFSYTASLAYVMPLFGGLLADVALGRFATILIFSCVYIVGSTILAVTAAGKGSPAGAALSLILVSIGTGGIKPCVSAFGADQLSTGEEESDTESHAAALRSHYFSRFYLAINIGSIFSFVVTPALRVRYDFAVAFGASAIVLTIATVLFACGARWYRRKPPAGGRICCKVLAYGVRGARARCLYMWQRTSLYHTLTPDTVGQPSSSTPSEGANEVPERLERGTHSCVVDRDVRQVVRCLRSIAPVLALMPCFWAVFDQQGSTWIVQASKMRRDGILPYGWDLPPEVLQGLNPIFVVIFVPSVSAIFDKWSTLFRGCSAPPALHRMAIGMFVAAVAFGSSAVVDYAIARRPALSVPVLWQVPQIAFITLAEVLVSVVSLDYFYAEAPEQAKSLVSALALLCVSIGDVLCGLLYQICSPVLGSTNMLVVFTLLMLLNCLVLTLLINRGLGKQV